MSPSPQPFQRVLVIDDDPVVRELLDALLGAAGYTVETEESGETALRRLRSGPAADIVLADMQMPGLSGADLAREVRSLAAASQLIGMSGSEPGADARAAFDAFLMKPFSPEAFTSLVAHPRGDTPSGRAAHAGTAGGPAVLDEGTFGRLAGTLPAVHLEQLYQLTLHDISERLDRMAAALDANDFTAYRQEAHALKGGCGMVGATELAALAAKAEMADAGSFGDTPAPEEFLDARERLRSILTAHFRQNG